MFSILFFHVFGCTHNMNVATPMLMLLQSNPKISDTQTTDEDISKNYQEYVMYLEQNPNADDYYDIKFFAAMSLVLSQKKEGSQDWSDLENIYDDLLKNKEKHNYGSLVIYYQNRMFLQRVNEELGGQFSEHHKDATVIERRELPSGNFVQKYAFSENIENWIESFKELQKIDFAKEISAGEERLKVSKARLQEGEENNVEAEVLKKLQDRVDYDHNLVENTKNVSEVMKLDFVNDLDILVRLHYGHQHFDTARAYINRVFDDYPESPSLENFIIFYIYSYIDEENYEAVRDQARNLIERFIPQQQREKSELYAEVYPYEKLAVNQLLVLKYQQAEKLVAENKLEEASQVFMEVAQEYQDYIDQYLHIGKDPDEVANAMKWKANSYESAGLSKLANQVYKEYVDLFPSRDDSRAILFRIADISKNSLDFDNALKYYNILYQQTIEKGIDYPDAMVGLRNIPKLYVGAGNYKEAAKAQEFLATKVDKDKFLETYFEAGDYWRKFNAFRGLEFYTVFAETYPTEIPEKVLLAHDLRIQIYEEIGNKEREIQNEWDVILEKYNQFKENGVELTPQMNRVGALATLRSLDRELEKITSIQYKKATRENEQENVSIFQEDVTNAVDEIASYCNTLKEFGVTESEIAYYYCMGQVLYEHSRKAREIPIPKDGFNEAVQSQYEVQYEILKEKLSVPIEEASIARLQEAQNIANEQEIWTELNSRVLETLHLLDPTSFYSAQESIHISVETPYFSKPEFVKPQNETTIEQSEQPKEEQKSGFFYRLMGRWGFQKTSVEPQNLSSLLSKFDLEDVSEKNMRKLIEDIQQLEQIDQNFEIQYNLGVAFLNMHEFSKASIHFQKAWNLDSSNIDTWYYLGVAFAESNNLEQALEVLSQGLIRYPQSRTLMGKKINVLYRLGKKDEALKEIKKALEDNGNNLEALYALGHIYMKEKRYDEALFILYTAKTKPGRYAPISTHISDILYLMGNEQVKVELLNAIEIDPTMVQARITLGHYYIDIHQYEKAKEMLEPVFERIPANIEVCNSLGTVYRHLNQPERAIEMYQKVVDKKMQDPVALINIAIVKAEHVHQYTEAISLIDEYLSTGSSEKNLAIRLKKAYQKAFEEQEVKRKEQEVREALLQKSRERQGSSEDTGDSGDSEDKEDVKNASDTGI